MYKLIVSDMDETFLGSDHKISQNNIDALKKLNELGIKFVPSSGRPYWSLMQTFTDIKDLLEDTYIVSFNGGCINKVGNNKPLYSNELTFENVQEFFSMGKELGVGMHIYELDGPLWGCDISDAEYKYLDGHVPIQIFDTDNIDFLKDKHIAKVLFVNPDLEWLEKTSPIINSKIEWGDTTISANRYLEINPKGVNKGSGLVKLAELLDVDTSEIIALGDSANDNEMLDKAGLGIAVANASENTKAHADLVAQSTADDGILKEILETYFL